MTVIKSKFNITGFWFLTLVTTYCLINFTSSFLDFFFHITILKSLTLFRLDDSNLFEVGSFAILSILFTPIICFNAVVVTIDSFDKTISFKNVLSKKERTYSFNELDGFVDTYYKDGYQAKFNIIYLVKNDMRIEKISGYFYSNYKDLKAGLESLAYLGFREFYLFKNLKILFQQNVPD
jgi:hypothetical protein